ncbi:DUF3088 domain-containing protein [Devosia rhizoryzae]|uniref:DUF3088 domain-containing protein n=1 Tax=Devosia rhizoryzae TaxID=2774137 RepID=A0ABX7CBY6_9HYPH|nr:DUF3088 domain-containing protein [Devosia rhizoryzae]QQR41207.1 DUF3088 domain-containing protein [Devosia rhizoryzae]
MAKDRLFLIEPGFNAADREDGPFVCPFCNQVEGLLASFPDRARNLEITRAPFARPRQQVVALVGEHNQALPLLIFGEDAPADAKHFAELSFVADTGRILELLAERHGFPNLFRPAPPAAAKVA